MTQAAVTSMNYNPASGQAFCCIAESSVASDPSYVPTGYPGRAKLALLIAAGPMETNAPAEVKQYICVAKKCAVNKKLHARILATGKHNSLGRADAIVSNHSRVMKHFNYSLIIGTPGRDFHLGANSLGCDQHQQFPLPTPWTDNRPPRPRQPFFSVSIYYVPRL